jgi:hypothetical protein
MDIFGETLNLAYLDEIHAELVNKGISNESKYLDCQVNVMWCDVCPLTCFANSARPHEHHISQLQTFPVSTYNSILPHVLLS